MYRYIKNPETNRNVNILSKKGRHIILKYLSQLRGGTNHTTPFNSVEEALAAGHTHEEINNWLRSQPDVSSRDLYPFDTTRRSHESKANNTFSKNSDTPPELVPIDTSRGLNAPLLGNYYVDPQLNTQGIYSDIKPNTQPMQISPGRMLQHTYEPFLHMENRETPRQNPLEHLRSTLTPHANEEDIYNSETPRYVPHGGISTGPVNPHSESDAINERQVREDFREYQDPSFDQEGERRRSITRENDRLSREQEPLDINSWRYMSSPYPQTDFGISEGFEGFGDTEDTRSDSSQSNPSVTVTEDDDTQGEASFNPFLTYGGVTRPPSPPGRTW